MILHNNVDLCPGSNFQLTDLVSNLATVRHPIMFLFSNLATVRLPSMFSAVSASSDALE